MPNSPSLWTRFEGGWCDNCRTAFSWIPANGNCPDCGPVKLRPATVTVEPHDTCGPPAPITPLNTEGATS